MECIRRLPARQTWLALASLPAVMISSGCLTSAGEQKLGDQAAEQVKQEMGLVAESEITRYVRAVCERLAAASERPEGPWSFQVADSATPNAFAIPGGHVYITRGLLALVNSEDELAGVMGHELGHVTGRHTAKRFSAAIVMAPITIVTGIAGSVTGIVSRPLGDAVAGSGQALSQGLVLAPYSRGQETDADRIGQDVSAKAGYDPRGLPRFLHTLDREMQRLSGEQAKFSFFANHPMTPDRVEKTTARAETIEWTRSEPIADDATLLALLDGLIVGVDPAQGIFRETLFLHPVLELAVQFPASWKTMNTAAAAGAFSPNGEAVVALQVAANDTTLDETAKQLSEEMPKLSLERLEVNGLPALRARLSQSGTRVVVTWIEYGSDIFAIVGQTTARDAYDHAFLTAADSFRKISPTEKASIEVDRLRLRDATEGETSSAIASRTGSIWDADEIAVANGIDSGSGFPAGTRVKVVLREPWRRSGN